MQDRFKYRCWHEPTKTMYEVFDFNENFIRATPDFVVPSIRTLKTRDCVLLQCTGLKDKYSKLIYEGNIIKIEYYDYGIKYRIGVVEWEDDGFCVTYHNAKDTKVSGCSLVDIVNGDKQEVIGNIYDNPELLEEVNNAR